MQDIRIIGLDLDGTVFDDQKRISPRTLAAIQAAVNKGVLVLPATGRTVSGVPQEFLHMPGVRYALTSNGASVVDLHTGEKLVQQNFDAEMGLQVFDVVSQYRCVLDVFVDGDRYSRASDLAQLADFCPPNLLPYLKATRHEVEDLRGYLAAHPGKLEKFSILYADFPTRNAAWQAVTQAFPVEATASLGCNMELNAPGVDKGTGLLALAAHLGYAPEQVMACGDSGNDLAMIRRAGLGVAMGNATPDILAAADHVTADNNHDGVALAIEKFVL